MPKKAPAPLEISRAVINAKTKYKAKRWLLWSRQSEWHGKRVQKYYLTREEAEKEKDRLLGEQIEHGRHGGTLTTAQLLDAQAALKILGENTSLATAAEHWRKTRAPKAAVTIRQFIPEYLAEKRRRGCSQGYIRAQAVSLEVLARARAVCVGSDGLLTEDPNAQEWGDRMVTEITSEELEAWLHAPVHRSRRAGEGTVVWKPLNLRNYARDFSMFFRFAKKRRIIEINPCETVTRPRVVRVAPEIYTPGEAKALLEHSDKHGLRPMYALALFSGIRIEELLRLRWEWIVWSENEIQIPGAVKGEGGKIERITKTGNPRNVTITPALRHWLRKRPTSGRIVDPKNLRNYRDALHVAAAVKRKRNGLRHTFASHHAARYRDPGLLQMELGQECPSVLFKHYIAAVSKRQAREFFALRPGS